MVNDDIRDKEQVPLRRWYLITKLHGVTSYNFKMHVRQEQ